MTEAKERLRGKAGLDPSWEYVNWAKYHIGQMALNVGQMLNHIDSGNFELAMISNDQAEEDYLNALRCVLN